ncbi:nuclear transport factor 2 family protein [Amnibacterium endophyticum]|uniref:Nuclear transport factor 2 family protein n=1 Tax=Amnibacterium endophyticum TaxID=2109337 RepID=A0ABW4LAH4_9MICO
MWDRVAAAEAANEWIRRYVRAWETNAPDDVRRLFTEDAEYRDGPSTPPWVGHDAIVQGWLGQQDEPGAWSFEHELTAVDGDVVVVRGWTHYPEGTAKRRRYDNLMVVRLDADGRARSFTDWWVAADADEE